MHQNINGGINEAMLQLNQLINLTDDKNHRSKLSSSSRTHSHSNIHTHSRSRSSSSSNQSSSPPNNINISRINNVNNINRIVNRSNKNTIGNNISQNKTNRNDITNFTTTNDENENNLANINQESNTSHPYPHSRSHSRSHSSTNNIDENDNNLSFMFPNNDENRDGNNSSANITPNMSHSSLPLDANMQNALDEALSDSANLSTKKRTQSVRKRYTPTYRFIRNVKNVEDLVKEYLHGDKNQPPVQSLEKRYGSLWRGGSHHPISKQYQRRKNIYNAIELGLNRNYSIERIIKVLEDKRTMLNDKNGKAYKKSMTWLQENIPLELL
ncbi:transcription activator GCR1-like domain-containing protein ASCRUDRAFT_75595 [Ascoidea rubescens DSM 1968]|uniref:Transcription activator GCR1-like domain-containing protein n=1 Tax=Ascoidea rubescens DSM 1968 TaxID=1344418 RepID=A0A1D2VJ09_9ASCO|nr:hypothetical protein ASCRUDRAFT_75595 [Ascoidea rubescens DSM 1968]ODV61605.1 hypothetical protein ASCRUDRAFT_75595 [Ascoidea rubescens DSM 1968]